VAGVTVDGNAATLSMGSFSATITLSSGKNTVTVLATDDAGNQTTVTRIVTLVTTPLVIGSFTIDDGVQVTNSTLISLQISASDESFAPSSLQMRLSNDGATWTAWQAYSTSASYTTPSGDGQKTVYLQVDDPAGNISETAQAGITLDTTAPAVTANPQGGLFNNALSITLTASQPGSAIYYTTDGTVPSTGSTQYQAPISIPVTASDTTIEFMSVDPVGNQSKTYGDVYIIDTTPPTVTASPAGGSYSAAQQVTLTSSKQGAIFYTIDGTVPNTGSPFYQEPISITASCTLEFMAVDLAGNQSQIYTESYVIGGNRSGSGQPPSLDWQIVACAQKDTGNDWTCNPDFSGIAQGMIGIGSTGISYQDTNGDGKNDQATITVQGGYPGYYNSLSFTVVNLGSASIPLSAVVINGPNGGGLSIRDLYSQSSYIQPGRRSVVGIDFRVNSMTGGNTSFTIRL
jgi:hypothetical protein